MRVLVTGGAGYIGSHVVTALHAAGHDVLVVDDLLRRHVDAVDGAPVVRLHLAEDAAAERLAALMTEHRTDAVMHFAARKQVGESVARPAWYYRENIGGLANLLLGMEQAAVTRLVFSSSAAVYGAVEGAAIGEDVEPRPTNPYGETKLFGEKLIAAAAEGFGLRAVSLRYFNVAGAATPELGDSAALNLIPMVFDRIEAGEAPRIFGDDYPTPDGTCVRDYIHVADLADAHTAALAGLQTAAPGNTVFNVGTGIGTSVRQMIERVLAIVGSDLEPVVEGRRPGDAAYAVASPARIAAAIGWRAQHTVDEMIASAWAARLARIEP
ncbi:MAG: UDP-glucose 4-epimerase GalE [Microbacteriaceae bacterium]|nr:UDP-glucose 4-epimerase GalE [Microbacteriaceae bacterium]MCL2794565.1 UDP-glucose 4-epimerase GalE [Microbacteriaceae bacterium]